MTDLNRNLPRIDTDRFSMVQAGDLERSTFETQHTYKTTHDASYLIPIYVGEVLPGDVFQGSMTMFARLATPVFPIMDNIEYETFFFFVPNRLLWTNWKKMMGERANPADSISYTVPVITATNVGLTALSIFDYFGLPIAGQLTVGQDISFSALPFRAYNFIWNEWFRDQNLQNQVTFNTGDGPDGYTDYTLLRRNKKHDYFTSALPWPLKGGVDVTMPLSGNAPVTGLGISTASDPTDGGAAGILEGDNSNGLNWDGYWSTGSHFFYMRASGTGAGSYPVLQADLSSATGATINALRLAVQTQRLLEKDARSGTRYTELLRAHFRVEPEDSRLQRPEYIGGGRTNIQTQAIPQTSQTSGTNVLGQLGASAVLSDQHSFTCYAKEHGYIIGLGMARAELTYQQGLARHWTKSTRYDIYWPVFANLGEQALRADEIYCTGTNATDTAVFGYQERWAEYRHEPSKVTGMFRSTTTNNIDEWHLAEQFGSAPALNAAFITDKTYEILQRILAAGTNANGMQILFDSVFNIRKTRPMPMYSTPGMMDHF